jgi:hypothetical protein
MMPARENTFPIYLGWHGAEMVKDLTREGLQYSRDLSRLKGLYLPAYV